MKKRKAFTIIELMVVVTIIAILASIAIVALERGRLQSRDAKRKADLSLIAGAMETYRADNKIYPTSTNIGVFCNVGASCPVDASFGQYLSPTPSDPVNDTTYKYKIRSNGDRFKVVAQSEGITSGTCTDPGVKQKSGDYCDSTNVIYFQVSSDITAKGWAIN